MQTQTLEQSLAILREEDKKFFDEAFTNPVTREPYQIPENLKRLSSRICRSYGIGGICDPMYIANVIAFELGFGDGLCHFNGKGVA